MPEPRPLLGVGLIILMAACFSALDASARIAGAAFPLLLMLWLRYGTQAVAMGVWLAGNPRHGMRSPHPRFQFVRGLLLLACSALSFAGIRTMPLPEFTAITMLTPLLVTALSATVLHERVGALRWSLVALGMLGALIVIRPGAGVFGWEVLYPIANACAYAAFQVLTRRLTGLDSPFTTHFWTGWVGLAVVTPLLALQWPAAAQAAAAADARQWFFMVMVGVLGTTGHLLLILALRLAPMAMLTPFLYTQVLFATLLGALLFQQWPDAWGWVGMAIITASGAASAWLNARGQPNASDTAEAHAD